MPSRIAICLFEEDITKINPADLLNGQPLTPVKLNTSTESEAVLLVKESKESPPAWAETVGNFADLNGVTTSTASSGAILFVKINTRVLACCFGSSVASIDRNKIVNDFGLAAAYQRISHRDIKSIESHTLSTNPITNNRSAAVATTRDNFNLDSYLENITEYSGRFYARTKSLIVKGKDFYSTPSPESLDDIINLCESLIEDYTKSISDEQYKRLTSARKVKHQDRINYLNDTLCKYINKRSDLISILDYEIIPDVDYYTLTPKGSHLQEITVTDFYNDLPPHKTSLAYLKGKHITVYSANGGTPVLWSLYKCIFFNAELSIGSFILYKGNWYEIQKRYLDDLRGFIRDYEIDSASLKLPKWDGKQDEGKYNKHAASIIGGQCWDKILYTHADYPYGIEFCDILSSSYVMHVKKQASSALNSHLLLQTAVSAQLFHFDAGLKAWIKDKSKKQFKKNIILNSKNELKNPNLSYLIVLLSGSKKSLSASLPFFSLVSFNIMIKKIVQLNIPVRLCKV